MVTLTEAEVIENILNSIWERASEDNAICSVRIFDVLGAYTETRPVRGEPLSAVSTMKGFMKELGGNWHIFYSTDPREWPAIVGYNGKYRISTGPINHDSSVWKVTLNNMHEDK